RLQVIHRLGGGRICFTQVPPGLRALERGKDLRDIAPVELGKAPKSCDSALDVRLRHGGAEVRANFGGKVRDGLRITQVAPQAGLERSVVAAEVDLRIQPVDVPLGVGEGKAGLVQPVQVPVDHAEKVLAL